MRTFKDACITVPTLPSSRSTGICFHRGVACSVFLSIKATIYGSVAERLDWCCCPDCRAWKQDLRMGSAVCYILTRLVIQDMPFLVYIKLRVQERIFQFSVDWFQRIVSSRLMCKAMEETAAHFDKSSNHLAHPRSKSAWTFRS